MEDSAATSPQSDVYVVECEPRYQSDDNEAMRRAREALIDKATSCEKPRVVVDLSETTFFGSAFVGLLFSLREKVARLGGQLAACGANEHCRDVLEVTRFTNVCPLFGSRSEAIQAVAK
ncbi:MAG: STAS domain-containing protein [Pirellulales bacterium]|nr:STAS domain-containing protein [Pirellulales bacterium]